MVVKSAVGGFHVYGASWSPILGKQLEAEREPGNPDGSFTVCYTVVKKNELLSSR